MSQYDLDIEPVIKALLEGSSALAALVSSRIYLDTRPEDDPLPAAVFEIISNRQDNARAGEQEKWTARIQVNCMGNTAKSAVDVRKAVLQACHRAAGSIAGVSVIASIHDGSSGDSYDALVDIYTKPIDFIVRYLR